MSLSDSIWWTRKARIQAEKRLLSGAFQSQIVLLWYSFCSVSAAVYYLKFNTQSEYAGISWVVFSVLVLCVSGFINGLGHKERAALVKDSYEALNSLYQKAKENTGNADEIVAEYEKILNVCENHADIDYQLALCNAYLSQDDPGNSLDRMPTKYIWFLVVKHYLIRGVMLLGFYFLPVILFILMEFYNVGKGTV